jgi:prepilin-type N-terminal cleavage/methylation domain-containing protein
VKATRGGFTLIEMLVVITIIAILVGLLFPAFQGVFRSAYETQCQNHLNQLGQITVAWCQAHDGRFPPPGDGNVLGKPGGYTSGWLFGGTATSSATVNNGIFYRDKLIGDLSILWCPVHFDAYNMYRPSEQDIYWKTDNTTPPVHANSWRLWSSYKMNGNVYYDPTNPLIGTNRTEPRLLSDFTANHFLFVEVHETKGGFSDSTVNPTTQTQWAKIAERHQGYGYIACMDGHVIKMTPDAFENSKRLQSAVSQAEWDDWKDGKAAHPEYKEYRWVP